MKECSYCYTKNPLSEYVCNFCEAPLDIMRPVLQEPRKFETEDIIYLTNFNVLKDFTHIELLQLHDLIRKNRNHFYKENSDDREKYIRIFNSQLYLVQNILMDKMGRIPKVYSKSEIAKYENLRKKSMEKRFYDSQRKNENNG